MKPAIRSRFGLVAAQIRHAKEKGDVWFATHAEVARYAKDNAVASPQRAARV